MKVLEEEVGKACNRETIAKSKLTKLMTITSEDFELNTEIIGTSKLMNSGDFFTIGKISFIFEDTLIEYSCWWINTRLAYSNKVDFDFSYGNATKSGRLSMGT